MNVCTASTYSTARGEVEKITASDSPHSQTRRLSGTENGEKSKGRRIRSEDMWLMWKVR